MTYKITYLGDSTLSEEETGEIFPRRIESIAPDGYEKTISNPDMNLDAIFGSFNKWAFTDGRLPKDLSAYLHCFDYASQSEYGKYKGSPSYTWYSLVILPMSSATTSLKTKWNPSPTVGFDEMQIVSENPEIVVLNNAFPKIAALAGYKKDCTIKKGWMTYKDDNLCICSGKAKKPKCNAPPGTAFHGEDHQEPNECGDVLCKMSIKVDSLHELFCVAEGLLRTM